MWGEVLTGVGGEMLPVPAQTSHPSPFNAEAGGASRGAALLIDYGHSAVLASFYCVYRESATFGENATVPGTKLTYGPGTCPGARRS